MSKRNYYDERKQEKALRASQKRSERRLKRLDTKARKEANTSHKTYQSPLETPDKGWLPQHLVNKVLSLWSERHNA